jgi:hypothetical protein
MLLLLLSALRANDIAVNTSRCLLLAEPIWCGMQNHTTLDWYMTSSLRITLYYHKSLTSLSPLFLTIFDHFKKKKKWDEQVARHFPITKAVMKVEHSLLAFCAPEVEPRFFTAPRCLVSSSFIKRCTLRDLPTNWSLWMVVSVQLCGRSPFRLWS